MCSHPDHQQRGEQPGPDAVPQWSELFVLPPFPINSADGARWNAGDQIRARIGAASRYVWKRIQCGQNVQQWRDCRRRGSEQWKWGNGLLRFGHCESVDGLDLRQVDVSIGHVLGCGTFLDRTYIEFGPLKNMSILRFSNSMRDNFIHVDNGSSLSKQPVVNFLGMLSRTLLAFQSLPN